MYVRLLAASAALSLFVIPSQPRAAQAEVSNGNEIRAGVPSFGDERAPHTITVWNDFSCSFCRVLYQDLVTLESKHHGQVRVAFKSYPLPSHDFAMPLARAARAAARFGKHWEMAPLLFTAGSPADVLRAAVASGISESAFRAAWESPSVAAEVDADVREGQAQSLRATPTFFFDGERIEGSRGIVQLERLLK